MPRVWSGGVLAAAWLSASLVAQSPWTELRGEGFVLRGQLSANTLITVACDLETAARVLRPSFAATGVPPKVVAVENARGIREWLPEFNERGRGNPLGAYWRGLYGDHIVVRIDAAPAERLRRVLHEYAHFVTHVTNPEPAPWLDEGISEIWEHAAIVGGAIEVGRPVPEHLKRLRSANGWIPVAELVDTHAIPTHSDSASAMFYAESWALVHYLMFEKHGSQVEVDRPPDYSDLPSDEALRAYVLGPIHSTVKILTAAKPGGCSDQTAAVRPVAPLDALLQRAQALADGERPDAALPLLREAAMMAPDNIEIMETIGFVHFRGNRPVEAAGIFDRVIRSERASHLSYYYRALLAGPVPERSDGGGPVSPVDYLKKAIALDPGFAPAVRRLRELTGKRSPLASRAPTVRHLALK